MKQPAFCCMNFLSRTYIKLVSDRWGLGFIEEPLDSIIEGQSYTIHYVKGLPKTKWYADPFILGYNENTIELLVEEYRYRYPRGRIAKITISRKNYHFLSEKIILDLDTHLSFPFIQRVDNKIYVYPENCESGGWHQYEYDSQKEKLVFCRTIINEPLTDAVLVSLFGRMLIFTTIYPDACGSFLLIFDENGKIVGKIKLDSNVARGAGDWLLVGDRVIRPAQDCNGGYGKAVVLQEVTIVDGLFELKEIRRLKSRCNKYSRGLHTFNHYNGLSVIDLFGYRWGLVGHLTDYIKSIIKKVKQYV